MDEIANHVQHSMQLENALQQPLGGIRITQQQQQRQRKGENADRPGIHSFPGTEHQNETTDGQSQRPHYRHIPADILGEFST